MIKDKGKGLLIVVSGPSGTGKGTICKKIIEEVDNIELSVSMTSRKPRINEIDGKDYYFVSKEEFEKNIKNNQFLEYAIVHSNEYYGTPKAKIEESLNKGISIILEIDIQGALKVKEANKDAIFIFIMPPSMKILKERLENRRTETKEKIMERFKTAYKELNEYKKYNYVVVNDKLDEAIEKVKSIILSEKCRVDRIEDIYLDTIEEVMHETLMEKEFDN